MHEHDTNTKENVKNISGKRKTKMLMQIPSDRDWGTVPATYKLTQQQFCIAGHKNVNRGQFQTNDNAR